MDLILKKTEDFDIERILECGQCFHFVKLDEKEYGLCHKDRFLHISQKGNDLIFHDTGERDFKDVWEPYFDMAEDYKKIKDTLIASDPVMEKVIKKSKGIRILNQSFFETLISFIISQNKQIPHIKAIVRSFSADLGTYLGSAGNEDFYSFPGPKEIVDAGEDALRALKVGFRAPYIMDAAKKVLDQDISEDLLLKMEYPRKLEILKSIYGVGDKVANCVILFSLRDRSAFPVDVWIKRIMEELFFEGKDTTINVIQQFAEEKFGDLGGYAQQYLFDYGRNMKE